MCKISRAGVIARVIWFNYAWPWKFYLVDLLVVVVPYLGLRETLGASRRFGERNTFEFLIYYQKKTRSLNTRRTKDLNPRKTQQIKPKTISRWLNPCINSCFLFLILTGPLENGDPFDWVLGQNPFDSLCRRVKWNFCGFTNAHNNRHIIYFSLSFVCILPTGNTYRLTYLRDVQNPMTDLFPFREDRILLLHREALRGFPEYLVDDFNREMNRSSA